MPKTRLEHVGGTASADNWILTTAIGGEYFDDWRRNVQPSWDRYAREHGAGIAVATGDLFTRDQTALNGAWQKLLAPSALRDFLCRDVRFALLDTDVVISSGAPSIFDAVERGRIGVVSHAPNECELRLANRVAMLRKTFLDPSFPLSSLLNATPQQVFEWAGIPPHDMYFCAGVIVGETDSHADLFAKWYDEAPASVDYVNIGALEEVWLNHCVQSRDDVQWLEYRWQALWIYEVAEFFPFLYGAGQNSDTAQWCLAASLLRNHFVHLSGRWESRFLKEEAPILPGLTTDFWTFAKQLSLHEAAPSVAKNCGTLLPPN